MDSEPEDTVTKHVRQVSWLDDGLAADRAKHPLRNAFAVVMTVVAVYGLFFLECDGARDTCRGRHAGAGAVPAGLIVLALAVSLWRMPVGEAMRLASVPGQSIRLMRCMPAFGVALVSGGVWLFADSFSKGTTPAALLALTVFVPSAVLAFTTGRWGAPRALVPPPLRGAH